MKRAALLPLAVLLAAPPVARADDTPQPAPPPPPATPEVMVIGDKPDSLQKIPGSGTVVSQKEIDRAQPYDTGEMLRHVPGLQVREEDGGGLRLDVGVRGLDPGRSRRVLMLEDGVPIAVNPYAESDTYYIPPIERMRGIEVVKGSGSILFGPQTIGGVINFFTLTPPTHQISAVDVWGGDRGYRKALAMYGDANGPLRYVVQVFHKEGDGFRGEAFASTDAFVKTALDTSAHGEATLKIGFHDDQSYSDDLGLTTAMFAQDPRRPTLAPHDHISQQNYAASLIHEQHFGENTTLKTLAYAYMNTRIWNRQNWTQAPSPGTSYDRIVGDTTVPGGAFYFENNDTIQERAYQVAGIEPRLTTSFLTGPVAHTVDTGARVLVETARYDQRAGDTPYSNAGTLVNEELHTTYAFAGYAQDRLAFTDRLLVTPGFRVEQAQFSRDLTRVSTGQFTGVDTFIHGDQSTTGLIPGIGLIYGTRKLHAFAGMHVGWAPPRLTDAVSARGTPSQVDAEQSYNYELGARAATPNWLRAEGTLFYSWFTNQVVTGSSGDLTQLVNGGHTRHVGVEGSASLGLGRLLKLHTTDIDLGVRYTFVRATFADPPNQGNIIPYSPMHTVGATLDASDKIGLGGQVAWYFVAPQFTDANDTVQASANGATGRIPAYNVLDLGAHYHHAPTGLTLKLVVKGMLDDIYISERRPNGVHAAGFREVMLGLSWDYEKAP